MDWSNVTFLFLDSVTIFTEPRSQALSSEGKKRGTGNEVAVVQPVYPTNTMIKDKKFESVSSHRATYSPGSPVAITSHASRRELVASRDITPTRLPIQSCLLRASTVPIANQAVLHGLVFTVNTCTASR